MIKNKQSQYPGLSLSEPVKDPELVAKFEKFVNRAKIKKSINDGWQLFKKEFILES